MIAATHPAESPEFLSRLHDGELDPGEAAAFEAHRAECGLCRAAAAEFERALSAFREAPVAPVASDLSARILRKIRATTPSRRPFGVMFGIDVRWAGVLAAALLVVIIGSPVFSRRPMERAPSAAEPSGPIPAYVLDAREERFAGKVAEAPPPAELQAPKPAAPPAAAPRRAPERNEEPARANAAPEAESDDAGGRIDAAEAAVPAAPPESKAQDSAAQAPQGLRSRQKAASAPAEGQAGLAASAESPGPVRLTIRAVDGLGTAPALAGAPSDERLAALRGGEFVLVVESDGRVRAIEKRPTDKKLAKDEAAPAKAAEAGEAAEVVLRELVFQPGDRSRRLTVAVH